MSTILLSAACGGDSNTTTDGAPGDGANAADARVDSRPIDGVPYTVTWGPLTINAGEEDTRCVTVRLSNTDAIKVRQIHNVLAGGSHHFIVYRDAGASGENLTPTPCSPFAGTLGTDMAAPLMITQRPDEILTLPERVAFTLEAEQFVRLEMHYINTTDQPIELTATSSFYAVPDTEVDHEADFLFIGSPDIDQPVGQSSLRAFFTMPSSLAGANFFALTGHTHQHGTDMNIWVSDGPDGTDTSVYDPAPFIWDEPETTRHEPAFTVPSGGGFDFECGWNNTSGSNVQFGESANEEMCFFWAYYYPSRGAKVCIHTDQFAGGYDGCCPDLGPEVCGQLLGP